MMTHGNVILPNSSRIHSVVAASSSVAGISSKGVSI